MNESTQPEANNPTDSLWNIVTDIDAVKFIESRRDMLQRIAGIVNAIQRLTESLDNLMISSGNNPNIADKTFSLLDYLDDKQRHLETGKIEIRIDALDDRIRDQLSKILSSIHADTKSLVVPASGEKPEDDTKNPLEIVTEFRRKVRLSMAYRLLLTERGMDIDPINLDIAPQLISVCLKKLAKEETVFKNKLVKEIVCFRQEISELLKSETLSDKMRQTLKVTLNRLAQNIKYIKSDKPLEVLPEAIDLDEFSAITSETGAPVETTSEADDLRLAPVDESAAAIVPAKGFFNTLNKWISAPIDVSWKESKQK